MSIQVISDNKVIPSKLIIFSDGAVNLWIDPSVADAVNYVSFVINTDTPVSAYRDIICIAEKVITCGSSVKMTLSLPYFPNARADREFDVGMSNPLSLFCDSINTDFWDEIHADDIHNIDAISNNLPVIERPQLQCFKDTVNCNHGLKELTRSKDLIICAPDRGSYGKATGIASYFNLPCAQMEKVRNPKTGWIESVKLISDTLVNGKDILIIDDICDGGMTFVKTAESLKDLGANSVSLYVTHGIFSKGLRPLAGFIDQIYCKHLVMNYVSRQDISKFNGEQ